MMGNHATNLRDDEEPCGFTIYWRIENFNSEPSNDFCVRSENLNIASMNADWQIEVEVDNGCLGAFIRKKNNPISFLVHYSLSFLSSSGWIDVFKNVRGRFENNGPAEGAHIVDLPSLSEDHWDILPNGAFTVRFHLYNNRTLEPTQCLMISRVRIGNRLRHRPKQFYSNLKPSEMLSFPSSYDFQKKQPVPVSRSSHVQAIEKKSLHTQTDTDVDFHDAQELLKMFKDKKFSFVTLRTVDGDFSVHKAVLSAKSPVFKAMFERQMKESDCNVVDIEDVDSQTMAALIKFLHFEPMGDLRGEAITNLYYAADKYQIDPLKKKCISLLKNELSIDNICDALLLADLHQDTDLMKHAQEFFCKNSKLILPSKQWKSILGHTELVANLLCRLVETM